MLGGSAGIQRPVVVSGAGVKRMRILILGGYGVFGGRLAELLSDLPEIEIIVCGRDLSRAEAFCARYGGQA